MNQAKSPKRILSWVLVLGIAVSGACSKDPATTSTAPTSATSSVALSTGTTAKTTPSADAAAATPKGMFAAPADPNAVIDEASAAEVFESFWPLHIRAVKDADRATIEAIETGPAAQWNPISCFAGCKGTYGDLVGEPVFTAPPQQGYPAYFAAQAQVKVTGFEENGSGSGVDTFIIVFTRAAADAPWLATLTTWYGGADPVLRPGSSMIQAPIEVTGEMDPRDLPQRLAEYFHAYKRDGRPPEDSPFHDNGAIAERGRTNARIHAQLEAAGISDDTQYRNGADEDGYYEFAAGPNTVLACSTIRWTTTNEPMEPGGSIKVTKDGGLFPAIVPPGTYARVEREGVRQACFHFNSDCSCLRVSGLDGGNYEARTTPA